MDKKIINEINRFREISGLPLINEQLTLLDNLISGGVKRVQVFDDVIEALGYTSKNLSDEEITNISVNLYRNKILDYEASQVFENTLKSNMRLRSALSNRSTNFIEEIKKTEQTP